jgi:glycosyltransferase involved in cell wall biosynthesis
MKGLYRYWKKEFKGDRIAVLRYNRWLFLRDIIYRYNVANVLEFGSGLSTLLFDKLKLNITSCETDLEYMERVKNLCSHRVNFINWNGRNVDLNEDFDLALVDGALPRLPQALIARRHSKIVAIDNYGGCSRGTEIFDDWVRLDVDDGDRFACFLNPSYKQWPSVSVMIAHRNDFAMLAITIRSILEELNGVDGGGEIIVVDNSTPDDKELVYRIVHKNHIDTGHVKMLFQDFPSLTTARNTAVENALSKYILSLDSHMLLGAGMIRCLVEYADEADKDVGLIFAPLMLINQDRTSKRHEFKTKDYYNAPSSVGLRGMPWLCRRSFWNDARGYGFMADKRMSWGGTDIYLVIKSWLLGYRSIGVPCRPGFHIGPFKGLGDYTRYRRWSKSGDYPPFFGALAASYILGEDSYPNRITRLLPKARVSFKKEDWERAKEVGQEERVWLQARQKMSLDEYFDMFPHLTGDV